MGKERQDIEILLKQGAEFVKDHRLKKALSAYESAYNSAKELNEEKITKVCGFNVGAVYIALGEPEKGMEILKETEHANGSTNQMPSGDFSFNFGLAYESLKKVNEAIRCYKDALKVYEREDDYSMQGCICVRLARIHASLKHRQEAASYFRSAARAYGLHGDVEKQVSAKCEQANQLHIDLKQEEALALAEDCFNKCSDLTAEYYLGFMYNDLGLIFTQCRVYDKAQKCFELGLQQTHQSNGDEKQEVVILQNLGALYNFMREYQKSIHFHEKAANKYAKLGNRWCQGQCFTNQAFAYSQLGKFEQATESFLHALQAAKDSDDKHSHWQVLEGLGGVSFNQGRIEKAIEYFKAALAALGKSEEYSNGAQERLVSKLSKTLEFRLQANSNTGFTKPVFLQQTEWPPQTINTVQRNAFENKTLMGVGDIPMDVTAEAAVLRHPPERTAVTRPSSRRFRVVPRGLSVESLRQSGTFTQSDDTRQFNRQISDKGQDHHIERYAERIRQQEMAEISEKSESEEESGSEEESVSEEDSDSEDYTSSSEAEISSLSEDDLKKGQSSQQLKATSSSGVTGAIGKDPSPSPRPSSSYQSGQRPATGRIVKFRQEDVNGGHLATNSLLDVSPHLSEREEETEVKQQYSEEKKKTNVNQPYSVEEESEVKQREKVIAETISDKRMRLKADEMLSEEEEDVQEEIEGFESDESEKMRKDEKGTEKPREIATGVVKSPQTIQEINRERNTENGYHREGEDSKKTERKSEDVRKHSEDEEVEDEDDWDEIDSEFDSDDDYEDEYEDDTDEYNQSNSAARRKPQSPVDSPPRTLHGTYESPVIGESDKGKKLLRASPHYAEIDFSASGRPIQHEGQDKNKPEEEPQTSNFFHSDDNDSREGHPSSTLREERENLYETIHPREERAGSSALPGEEEKFENLPRGERERLLYEAHQKEVSGSESTVELPNRKTKSGLCSIM